jgi:glycosyltransferase involved in cell wall biosynthesis
VVDQEVGAVFETGSALSLAAALRQLLLSPVRLWQMGQRGRQRAIRCHSLQQEADRINALYGLLMA